MRDLLDAHDFLDFVDAAEARAQRRIEDDVRAARSKGRRP